MKLDVRIFMYFLDNIIVQNYLTDLQNGPLKTHFIKFSTYIYLMIQFIFYLQNHRFGSTFMENLKNTNLKCKHECLRGVAAG